MEKAVVFDIGKVLLDWDPRHLYRTFFPKDPSQMEWFLQNVCTLEWNDQHDQGIPYETTGKALSEKFPTYVKEIEAFRTRWEEMMDGPIEGTVTLAKELHQKGFPLFVLSNFSAEKFPIVRKKYEFFNWFQGIFISGEVGVIKPDPKIYTLFLNRFHLEPSRCLFIDDRKENIEAAKRLGMEGILFQTPEQLREDLIQKGLL